VTIRVLVVEDEPVAAEAHRTYLERVPGFAVAGVAHTGRDAHRLVAAGGVDVILLDMHLPDMHGLELLHRLRTQGHLCDVIAVTSVRDLAVVRRAMAHGVSQYLLKPFTFATFRDKLEQYASYAARLGEADGPVAQHEVDRLFVASRPGPADHTLPKGMSPETLDAVTDALRAADGTLSASEVAGLVGISRVTARRYLEHLAGTRVLERRMRHGGTGRPEGEYRWAR